MRYIMEQTFNKTFSVDTYDVAGIQKNWRIVYFPEQQEMMVVKSHDKAAIVVMRSSKPAYVLTRRQAPRSFPSVFSDSEAKTVSLQQRTVLLIVSPEKYAFLAKQGNISAYLRSLIEREMQNL
jgi:hypothetical protein